jgi:quercetin dioxygenase-like cupin family protein
MQILRFPPHADGHPEHDHSANGEEEVYTVLEGEITLHAGGEEHVLVPERSRGSAPMRPASW